MKKLFILVLAIVLSIAVAFPALASAQTVQTGVEVTQGGGNIPVVKCKWETPDDADPGHTMAGTQVKPPLVYAGTKEVQIWVVVTDVEDSGSVAQVVADVYHPEGVPANGSIKFNNVPLTKVAKFAVGIPAFVEANKEGLIAFNDAFNYTEVLEELNQCRAEVWVATVVMDYHQPAGDHRTVVTAIDTQGNSSAQFTNVWNYYPMSAIEIDFSSVQYPPVMISKFVWVDGDTEFGTANAPTIRNLGNVPAFIFVKQDDMGFDKYLDGTWKVQFDARMGPAVDDQDSTKVLYDPFVTVKLPNALPLCYTKKLDFSIHVKYATPGLHSGTMTITCKAAAMTDAYPASFPGYPVNVYPSPMSPS